MKLLFDENLSHRLAVQFAAVFPGSEHVESVGLRGGTDSAIWDYALAHNLVIASKDNDFRQLSVLHGPLPKVVWLSVGNAGTDTIGELLRQNVDRIAVFSKTPEEGLLVLELASD